MLKPKSIVLKQKLATYGDHLQVGFLIYTWSLIQTVNVYVHKLLYMHVGYE